MVFLTLFSHVLRTVFNVILSISLLIELSPYQLNPVESSEHLVLNTLMFPTRIKNRCQMHWRKNDVIDQGKYRKKASKRKRTGRDYHIQKKEDMNHSDVEIYFHTTQFSAFKLCGPHNKPHGVRGLIKHYNIILDPKIGYES